MADRSDAQGARERTTRTGARDCMGSVAEVTLLVGAGAAPTPADVLDRLDDLERRWSQFRPDSELRRCAGAAGSPVVVSPETSALLLRARHGWWVTGGRFDPSVAVWSVAGQSVAGRSVAGRSVGAGPDRHAPPPARPAAARPASAPTQPAPGLGDLLVDPVSGLVRLPPGVAVDPGGLGKGLAADLAAVEAVAAGATGVLVSVGGDLRVAVEAPDGGWDVLVDHDAPATAAAARPVATVSLHHGALATSSVRHRRRPAPEPGASGRDPAAPWHHLLDPRTGRPAQRGVEAVTVLAAEAWWAEVLATTLVVAGVEDPDALDLLDAAGALVTLTGGERRRLGRLGDRFRPVAPAAPCAAGRPRAS